MSIYHDNLLEQAQAIWASGRQLSLDLFAKLAAEGFDVPALEELYLVQE